jgi:hypothetical protein
VNEVITFRLTVDQFQRMLSVILATDTPDDLTNLVLMACTRPKNGIISVPVPPGDAERIAAVLAAGAQDNPAVSDIADVLRAQLPRSTDGRGAWGVRQTPR